MGMNGLASPFLWGSTGTRIFPAVLRDRLGRADIEMFTAALKLSSTTSASDRFSAPVEEPFDYAALNAAWNSVSVRTSSPRENKGRSGHSGWWSRLGARCTG
jgi:hypothetical protein